MGRALKALRESRELTQQEAADRAGVTRTAWQNYESGRAVILRSDLQRRLARSLGADEEELALHAESFRNIGRRSTAASLSAHDRAQSFDGLPRGQAVFPLAEGEVVITFPQDLSREGFAEMAQYLSIFLKGRGAKLDN